MNIPIKTFVSFVWLVVIPHSSLFLLHCSFFFAPCSLLIATCSFLILAPAPIPAYTGAMTIEQTVEIPADHRLVLDVPREIPAGTAVVAFTPVSPGKTAPELGDGKIHLTQAMIAEMLQDETLRSLTGLLHTDISPGEIRAERLKKHEHPG
jgi:hypothetical protein